MTFKSPIKILGYCSIILGMCVTHIVGASSTSAKDSHINLLQNWDDNNGDIAVVPIQSLSLELINQLGGYSYTVAVQGEYAFVGEGPRLTILNISNPSAIFLVSKTAPFPGVVKGVALTGTIAYVIDDQLGLHIINIADPAAPAEIASLDTPGTAMDIVVVDNYAYVADYDHGLRIIDISNPTIPAETTFFDTPGYASGVFVAGDFAYIADYDHGLFILDVSNPSAPVVISSLDTPGFATSVAVAGNYTYVTDDWRGLRIVDISIPTEPFEAGFATGLTARDVTMVGSYAYVASYSGLTIFEVTNPGSLPERSTTARISG